MRIFVTGGTGVLGHALLPLLNVAGHTVVAPSRAELDLFDAHAVGAAMDGIDAVFHLATRIQPLDKMDDPAAWRENDRLRAEASEILVDAALKTDVGTYVQPSITFVYPSDGPATEDTPIGTVGPTMRSALVSEDQTERFAASGRRGVVLRLGLLDGPGTGNEHPVRDLGSTLHVIDAGRALLAALTVRSGIYNVCRSNERVSNRRFIAASGWSPLQ